MGPWPDPQPEIRSVPAQETRGGNRVNWADAKPGEALPELPPEEYPEPDSEQLPLWNEDGAPDDGGFFEEDGR